MSVASATLANALEGRRARGDAAARAAMLDMVRMELALHLVRHKTAVLNAADHVHLAPAVVHALSPALFHAYEK